ncbi:HEAT repeat domain-containing protein [Treponema berlinense]|uniref:HEAT repeat domain-containing protein n=1 Tax=Treponema berlinense TaxID=225004 RepID=UPI003FD6D139
MKKNILVLTAFCFLKLQVFGQTVEAISDAEKTVQLQNLAENETSPKSRTQTEDENSPKSETQENAQALSEEENSPETENQENVQSLSESENSETQTEHDNSSEENSDVDDEAEDVSVKIPKKRPQKQDAEKIAELDEEFPDTRKENADTLKFGMEDDIIDLLNDFVKNEDVRFVDEVYDLFYVTKTIAVREKILEYFTKLKDPCLENFALEILDDPYEQKKSTVDTVFKYIQAVKTKEALPAVLKLVESEDENYFTNALTTLGEIGGSKEAVFLSEYLEREDLSLAQRQQLVKVLGKIKAVETYDKLVEMAQDEDENTFIRMYSAEAIGSMEKKEAVKVLVKLYEDTDPKLRCSVVKGLSNFKENDEAKKTVIEAIRDSYVTVRLEAIEACKKNDYKEAVPYLVYRLEKDKEDSVKKKCYPAIACLNTKEGNEYLVKLITDKKVADTPKSRVATALLEYNNAGTDEIIALAGETLKDDRRKPLRYALGKEFAKYKRNEFSSICKDYLDSKDTATQGTGLDIYSKGRYPDVLPVVRQIILDAAKNPLKKNANAEKAKKILGSSDSTVKEAEKISEEQKEKLEKKSNPKANAK